MSTSRERVLTAIARKQPDRTPPDYKAEPEVNSALMTVPVRGALPEAHGGHLPFLGGRLHAAQFHGGLDTQSTLPFGSPEDVRAEVLDRVATLGAGGGYIIAPSHNIQPDTSAESILAMYEPALRAPR